MRYLLDTVALIMWWTDASRLGAAALEILEDGDAAIFLSAVSIWEVANKSRIGKLDVLADFDIQYPLLFRDSGFALIDLNASHAMRAGYLAGAHRDPFDRLLAGQALVEGMTILTNDPELSKFGCETLW